MSKETSGIEVETRSEIWESLFAGYMASYHRVDPALDLFDYSPEIQLSPEMRARIEPHLLEDDEQGGFRPLTLCVRFFRNGDLIIQADARAVWKRDYRDNVFKPEFIQESNFVNGNYRPDMYTMLNRLAMRLEQPDECLSYLPN